MTYRNPWPFALMLVPALFLLAPSGLAAETNMSFNLKANGKYLSCATSDIKKALSGAHPKTSLRGGNAEGYTALWVEMEEFKGYRAYRVIKDFPSETHTYWLGILDSNDLGIMGRPKGTDPGPRSYFEDFPHGNDNSYFAMKAIWVNKGKASEPSVGSKNDHWFLVNNSEDEVPSVDQGTKDHALSNEATEWTTSQ